MANELTQKQLAEQRAGLRERAEQRQVDGAAAVESAGKLWTAIKQSGLAGPNP